MVRTPAPYAKPLPSLQGITAQFYAWCKQRELRFQRCTDCGAWRHVPRPLCAKCGSAEWEWSRSSEQGTVFTWTVAMRPIHPAWRDDVPYAAVVVQMEEGVRLLSTLVDCPPDRLRIDMAVEVIFEDVTDDVTLPKFRVARRDGR